MNQVRHAIYFLVAVPALAAGGPLEAGMHRYSVSVASDLGRMLVEGRLGNVDEAVMPGASDTAAFILAADGCHGDAGPVPDGHRSGLPDDSRCFRYSVDLDAAAKTYRGGRYRQADVVVVSPAQWLWHPELREADTVQVTFELPDNVSVSVPWRPLAAGIFEFGRSPRSADGPVVFGKFHEQTVDIPGAGLRLALLGSDAGGIDENAVVDWLRAAATNVTLAYGRFPNPSPQVVVIPVGSRAGSPVPFGRVIRDGGETVEFYLDGSRPLDDLLNDWTATHEFSHLMLPYVGRRHRWISEGFAQYYQNLLMARAGVYTPQRAWQKLHEGLRRGRRSRPSLSPNAAAAAGVRQSLMKIYWSGAALALMGDVALREKTGGAMTLDVALDRLQRCCLPSPRSWSGVELFAKLDALTGTPVFVPLYRSYADSPGFPDTSDLFARLGVSVTDGGVSLAPEAELADVRDALMRTPGAGN